MVYVAALEFVRAQPAGLASAVRQVLNIRICFFLIIYFSFMFLVSCSPACTNGAVCDSTGICSCHVCATSSYTISCSSCSTSSDGCTIACSCQRNDGVYQSATILLTAGYGNGCLLGNNDGVLMCSGYCS